MNRQEVIDNHINTFDGKWIFDEHLEKGVRQ